MIEIPKNSIWTLQRFSFGNVLELCPDSRIGFSVIGTSTREVAEVAVPCRKRKGLIPSAPLDPSIFGQGFKGLFIPPEKVWLEH